MSPNLTGSGALIKGALGLLNIVGFFSGVATLKRLEPKMLEDVVGMLVVEAEEVIEPYFKRLIKNFLLFV